MGFLKSVLFLLYYIEGLNFCGCALLIFILEILEMSSLVFMTFVGPLGCLRHGSVIPLQLKNKHPFQAISIHHIIQKKSYLCIAFKGLP